MNHNALNQWLSLLANVGVVIGLIFLAIELRQNDESLQEELQLREANAFAQIEEQFMEQARHVASTPHLAELYARLRQADPKFTPAEMTILARAVQQDARMVHVAFRYWKAGHLPEPAWQKMVEDIARYKDASKDPKELIAKLRMLTLTNMPYDFLDYFELNDYSVSDSDILPFIED